MIEVLKLSLKYKVWKKVSKNKRYQQMRTSDWRPAVCFKLAVWKVVPSGALQQRRARGGAYMESQKGCN